MHMRILFHDNCFDGATSAALFSEFYRRCVSADATFEFVGLQHGPGDVFEGAFVASPGVEHACVDFRYSSDPRLTWWFDHHESAFQSDPDRAYFLAAKNPRHFYDPKARSCSKFLAGCVKETFGFDTTPHADLIAWADLIDGAKFDSPEQAVLCKEPALKLMLWVEHNRDPAHKVRFIRDLLQLPLADIAAQPHIEAVLAPLERQREQALSLLRQRAQVKNGVVTFDVIDQPQIAIGKFAPYYLYPDAHYVVGLSALPGRTKISVGSNPWRSKRRTANIAALCGQYGGGGHPAVGAVSFSKDQVAQARQAAKEIADTLLQAAQQEGPGHE
ncbi:MAG TPA: hypothetical protein PKE31_19475 [Pseudomonadota bacterium]|jgi:hypothetical protein|nr:hypothetical protein [Pseudomonadota bacterium]